MSRSHQLLLSPVISEVPSIRILCTNRDEYLDRPTQDAHFHSFQRDESTLDTSPVSGNILSGRDVKAGGSWLGLNRAGMVALLYVLQLFDYQFSDLTYTIGRI